MTLQSQIRRVLEQEDINFLLTNRIPRRLLTRFFGWFSQIENPLVRDLSIGTWRLFSGLDLREAKKTHFRSMHDCFIRELKDGARPIDRTADILVSPCDAIVGACGTIEATTVYQAKGFPYTLEDLLCDREFAATHRNGRYATLRLTSSMYHRFHAPYACRVESVTHIPGDAWNVNPIALRRIERLFCKNERAAIRTTLFGTGHPVTLVVRPGAAAGFPNPIHLQSDLLGEVEAAVGVVEQLSEPVDVLWVAVKAGQLEVAVKQAPPGLVDVFRPSGQTPDIARQAVAAGATALWLQLGIASAEARAIAEDAGLLYVEDRCLVIEQRRLNLDAPHP